jgi:predicted RNase H-like nuclease (RuvC/YqgF family)
MIEPQEPEFSCPHLDSAIEEIENARKIHDRLRRWGAYWKEQAQEIEKDLTSQIKEQDKYISQLEQEIEELKKT